MKQLLELEQMKNRKNDEIQHKPKQNTIEKDKKRKEVKSEVVLSKESKEDKEKKKENSGKDDFFEVPKNKKREFNEEDIDKYDDNDDSPIENKENPVESKEKSKEEDSDMKKDKKNRPTNTKYKENLDLNETTGAFFRTSINNEGKTQAQINREKEIAADKNLIEEGSESEDADLSAEIAKLEGEF